MDTVYSVHMVPFELASSELEPAKAKKYQLTLLFLLDLRLPYCRFETDPTPRASVLRNRYVQQLALAS